MKLFLLILLYLAWAGQIIYAQAEVEARFTIDFGTPYIGEPVRLILSVETPQEIVITQWPDLQNTDWELFTVQAEGEMTSRTGEDGITVYQQEFTLRLWYPGEYSTPDVAVRYQRVGQEVEEEMPVAPAFFSVPSVLDEQDLSLRPLKPQAWLPYISPLLVLTSAIVIAAALGLSYRLYRSRQAAAHAIAISDNEVRSYSPAQAALVELKRIQQQNPAPAVMYAAIADCLRTYIQRQFNIPAQDFTTQELAEALLHEKPVPDDLRLEAKRVLEQADLVKFAPYEPTEQSAKRYLNTVGRWIQTADKVNDMLSEKGGEIA